MPVYTQDDLLSDWTKASQQPQTSQSSSAITPEMEKDYNQKTMAYDEFMKTVVTKQNEIKIQQSAPDFQLTENLKAIRDSANFDKLPDSQFAKIVADSVSKDPNWGSLNPEQKQKRFVDIYRQTSEGTSGRALGPLMSSASGGTDEQIADRTKINFNQGALTSFFKGIYEGTEEMKDNLASLLGGSGHQQDSTENPENRWSTSGGKILGKTIPIIASGGAGGVVASSSLMAAEGAGSALGEGQKEGWSPSQKLSIAAERGAFGAVMGLMGGPAGAIEKPLLKTFATEAAKLYALNIAQAGTEGVIKRAIGIETFKIDSEGKQSPSDLMDDLLASAKSGDNIAQSLLFAGAHAVSLKVGQEMQIRGIMDDMKMSREQAVNAIQQHQALIQNTAKEQGIDPEAAQRYLTYKARAEAKIAGGKNEGVVTPTETTPTTPASADVPSAEDEAAVRAKNPQMADLMKQFRDRVQAVKDSQGAATRVDLNKPADATADAPADVTTPTGLTREQFVQKSMKRFNMTLEQVEALTSQVFDSFGKTVSKITGESLNNFYARIGDVQTADDNLKASKPNTKARYGMDPVTGKALFQAVNNADISSFIHEGFHFFHDLLKEVDPASYLRLDVMLEKALREDPTLAKRVANGVEDLTVIKKELGARLFERYMRDGVAPNEGVKTVFDKIRSWMIDVYKNISGKNHPLNVPIEKFRTEFNKWMNQDPEIIASAKKMRESATQGKPSTDDVSFTTSKGSSYTVDSEGRTTRTKSLHVGHDPSDVGLKDKSERTVYLSPDAASLIGLNGQTEGAARTVIEKNGKLYPVQWNIKENKWGTQSSSKDGHAFSTKPEVGLSPVELWGAKNDAQGIAYSKWHAGNEITKITDNSNPSIDLGKPVSSSARPSSDLDPPLSDSELFKVFQKRGEERQHFLENGGLEQRKSEEEQTSSISDINALRLVHNLVPVTGESDSIKLKELVKTTLKSYSQDKGESLVKELSNKSRALDPEERTLLAVHVGKIDQRVRELSTNLADTKLSPSKAAVVDGDLNEALRNFDEASRHLVSGVRTAAQTLVSARADISASMYDSLGKVLNRARGSAGKELSPAAIRNFKADYAQVTKMHDQKLSLAKQMMDATEMLAQKGKALGYSLRDIFGYKDPKTGEDVPGRAEKAGYDIGDPKKNAELQILVETHDKLLELQKKGADVDYELGKAKNKIDMRIAELRPKNVFDWISEGGNSIKTMLQLGHFSAPAVQGAKLGFSDPVEAFHSSIKMFSAISDREAVKIERQGATRPHAEYDAIGGLEIKNLEGQGHQSEELFNSYMAQKIPGAKMSQRVFTTYQNVLRRAVYDKMIDSLGHTPSTNELKLLANYVNVATGVGDLGRLKNQTKVMNFILWSPRKLLSNFQYLTGQPFFKAALNAEGASTSLESIKTTLTGQNTVANIIGKQYGKTLTGMAAAYAVVAIGNALYQQSQGSKNDFKTDALNTVGLDRRSSNFMKLNVGGESFDPLGGFSQVMTFLGRVSTGKSTSKGDLITNKTTLGATGDLIRSHLSPLLGLAFDMKDSTNAAGEPQTWLPTDIRDYSAWKNSLPGHFIPISVQGILDEVQRNGVSPRLAEGLLMALGTRIDDLETKRDKMMKDLPGSPNESLNTSILKYQQFMVDHPEIRQINASGGNEIMTKEQVMMRRVEEMIRRDQDPTELIKKEVPVDPEHPMSISQSLNARRHLDDLSPSEIADLNKSMSSSDFERLQKYEDTLGAYAKWYGNFDSIGRTAGTQTEMKYIKPPTQQQLSAYVRLVEAQRNEKRTLDEIRTQSRQP